MAKRKPKTLGGPILPLPNNARGIEAEQDKILGDGLRLFGDISGIVVDDETGWTASGNQRCRHLEVNNPDKCRIEILKEFINPDKPTLADGSANYQPDPTGTILLGLIWEKQADGSEIPFNYRRVRWTEEQIQQAALLANKAGGFFLLDKVAAFSDKIILGGGFSPAELATMRLGGAEPPEEPASRAEAQKPPEKGETKKVAKLGDIIELHNLSSGLSHRIGCGSSEDLSLVAEVLDGTIPVLCATDPPYGVNYDPSWRLSRGNVNAINKVNNDERSDWRKALEAFPGQVLYLWTAAKHLAGSLEIIDFLGFDYLYEIIWKKSNFSLSRGDYHWHHEPCLYSVRRGKPHNWQGSRKESTIWEIASNNAWGGSQDPNNAPTGHGTQKPLDCFARPIRNNTAQGESVYDPFLGSGTTLVASDQLGRNCYGIEIDPDWVDVEVVRWLNYAKSEDQETEIRINGKRSDKYVPTLVKVS